MCWLLPSCTILQAYHGEYTHCRSYPGQDCQAQIDQKTNGSFDAMLLGSNFWSCIIHIFISQPKLLASILITGDVFTTCVLVQTFRVKRNGVCQLQPYITNYLIILKKKGGSSRRVLRVSYVKSIDTK